MTKVTVIGAGAWGTALACVSARAGHKTVLWARTASQSEEMSKTRKNSRYLGELQIDPQIQFETNLAEATRNADVILLSVPAQTLNSILGSMAPLNPDSLLVTTCKGIDQHSALLPSKTVRKHFPEHRIAALSGPSFAHDVVQALPTAVTIAADEISIAENASKTLSIDTFRCYASDDLQGAELGGALKNVLALAVGAARGMKLGASAEAALIARGFSEISRLAIALGAKQKTLMGLSGLGDITLTCSSTQSRNFAYGVALGRGDDLTGLRLAEGAFTAEVALKLAKEQKIDVPITAAIVDVLEKRVTATEAVAQLLTRPLKRES